MIRGASGGIGHLGVQLAKELGASEIVAISSRVDYCKSLGATQVVNYREEKCKQTKIFNSMKIVYLIFEILNFEKKIKNTFFN